MSGGVQLWPPQASHHAAQIDLLIGSFGAMVWVFTLPVFVLMTYFAIRYRRTNKVNRQHAPGHNFWLEVSWAGIPFILILIFYVWATALFLELRRPPVDSLPINVVAKQWMWKFQHPEGAREINTLHVPMGVPVKLVMSSQDVIHSLYVPALRIKQDVVPGRYTTLWFNADKPGVWPIRCAEFCGTDHSIMGAQLIVMPPDEYAQWLARAKNNGTAETMAQMGERLFRKVGCSGCHGNASSVHAPPLEGIFGRPVGLSDGRTIIADEQYIQDSILLPSKDVAAGYSPIMPTYGNVLTPEQVNALVAYLKSTTTSRGSERQ
jgi:cytochrome c oxidase subunit 2